MLKSLKLITPELKIHPHVAVVGSSDRLLTTQYGSEIDQFTEVIRLNDSPTQGFKQHVGTKTTLYFMNYHVFFDNTGILKERTYFTQNIRNNRIFTLVHQENMSITDEYLHQFCHHSCEVYWLHRLQILIKNLSALGLTQYLNKETQYLGTTLNSGLVLILLLLDAGIHPHVYGFDFEEGRKYNYYYDKLDKLQKKFRYQCITEKNKLIEFFKKENRYPTHNLIQDRSILLNMYYRKKITLHV